jgi:hypothetical protein
MKKLVVSKEFTDSPGGRFVSDGPKSGEEFREKFLEPIIQKGEPTVIDMDGSWGYPTSFLDESFGVLIRKYGRDKVLSIIHFKSDESPDLIERIANDRF